MSDAPLRPARQLHPAVPSIDPREDGVRAAAVGLQQVRRARGDRAPHRSHELRDVSAVRCSAAAAAAIGGHQANLLQQGEIPLQPATVAAYSTAGPPGRRDRPAVEEVPGEHLHAHPPVIGIYLVRRHRHDVRTSSLRRGAPFNWRTSFLSPSVECASVEQTICNARSQRAPHVLAAEVEARSQPVHLERDALLERDLWTRSRAFSGRRPISRVFVGWLEKYADGSAVDAPGHPSRHALAAHARLHPVELGQYVVGEVEPAVGEDVAL